MGELFWLVWIIGWVATHPLIPIFYTHAYHQQLWKADAVPPKDEEDIWILKRNGPKMYRWGCPAIYLICH